MHRLLLLLVACLLLLPATPAAATYWLDGTMPAVVPPAARPVFPVQWVLPLTTRGEALEKLDWQVASVPDDTTLFDIDARRTAASRAQLPALSHAVL